MYTISDLTIPFYRLSYQYNSKLVCCLNVRLDTHINNFSKEYYNPYHFRRSHYSDLVCVQSASAASAMCVHSSEINFSKKACHINIRNANKYWKFNQKLELHVSCYVWRHTTIKMSINRKNMYVAVISVFLIIYMAI